MKYIVEIKPEYEDSFKGLMILGAKDSNLFVDTLAVDDLEQLNSDYINEHFGDLRDTAYQKGFEDGKAIEEKGCEGCRWESNTGTQVPCKFCRNCYENRWEAKKDCDEIKVGDVVKPYANVTHIVTPFVVTGVDNMHVWGVDTEGSWNYWAINEVTKTDKHFDIDKILEEMKE